MNGEEAVRLASRLYETRDAARTLLGHRYDDRIRGCAELLVTIAERTGRDVLSLATEAARDAERERKPIAAIEIIAAAVEVADGAGWLVAPATRAAGSVQAGAMLAVLGPAAAWSYWLGVAQSGRVMPGASL